jgi:AcrR family transcriptional regulator
MSPKEDSRLLILQAAFAAFSENGYDKTSMDDIVRRSGLSKGTLYWHFKNKHDLLLATINMVMAEVTQSTEAVVNAEGPAIDRFRRLFNESFDALMTNENLIGLIANFFFQSSQSPEAQQIMRQAYDAYINLLERLIHQGIESGEFRPVDARMVAIMLLGAGDGIAFQSLLKPDWDVEVVIQTFLDLAIAGLKKEHS